MTLLPTWLRRALPVAVLLSAAPICHAQESEPPLLVVLTETGKSREDLPVLAAHPEPEATLAALSRGLSGELLGVYRLTQRYLHRLDGGQVQPAYILLSSRQGGFASYGFWLDEERLDGVAYVDVHRDWPLHGDFGAIDQVFPHELWHAIRQHVVGPPDDGFANQVHSLGVRTDRGVAFNEGFAESLQALAVNHPDAEATTRALAEDVDLLARVHDDLRQYAQELEARVAAATRWRTGFVLWFSNGEDVLRYHGVRDNLYAHEPTIPPHLIDRDDPYAAYLHESVVPAAPQTPLRSPARMLAIEAVVAALGYAWASDEGLRSSVRDADFYALFDTTAEQVSPFQNVWLKIIHTAHVAEAWDAAQLIEGYRVSFPDEAPLLDALVERVFGTSNLQLPPELWLANDAFRTGTTLFDQFRGVPRTHTFDLNTASLIDLRGVPGVDLQMATRIRDGAPYEKLDDLARIEGVSPELQQRFEAMQAAMQELLERAVDEEETLSIQAILMPSVWRLGAALLVGAVVGALLYRQVRRHGPAGLAPKWWRAALAGTAAALAGIALGWAAGPAAGLASLAGVTLVFGLPAATICLVRGRGGREGAFALLAWVAAAVPAAIAVTPLF